MINAAIADAPADMMTAMHLCRGNFQSTFVASGGYEPVAEILFNEIKIQAYFMEYDSERAGGFEPLRFVPKGKMVVLGLVTSKSGTLESKDELKRRIDEAAKYIPLDQLCLSPQCGFASTEEGNILAEEEQWAKLRMIVEWRRGVGPLLGVIAGLDPAIHRVREGWTRGSSPRVTIRTRSQFSETLNATRLAPLPRRPGRQSVALRRAEGGAGKRASGEISADELKAVEDREIATLIKKQERSGSSRSPTARTAAARGRSISSSGCPASSPMPASASSSFRACSRRKF